MSYALRSCTVQCFTIFDVALSRLHWTLFQTTLWVKSLIGMYFNRLCSFRTSVVIPSSWVYWKTYLKTFLLRFLYDLKSFPVTHIDWSLNLFLRGIIVREEKRYISIKSMQEFNTSITFYISISRLFFQLQQSKPTLLGCSFTTFYEHLCAESWT